MACIAAGSVVGAPSVCLQASLGVQRPFSYIQSTIWGLPLRSPSLLRGRHAVTSFQAGFQGRVVRSSAAGAAGLSASDGEAEAAGAVREEPTPTESPQDTSPIGRIQQVFKSLQDDAASARAQVAKLGLAAVLSYGLLDAITYTAAFTVAFLGYEKSTGLNPAQNLKSLLGIVVLMWTSNNVTRPFRVAAAIAAAPFFDDLMKKVQTALRLPNQAFAFALVTASIAAVCLSVVGVLILSRLGG